MKPINNGVLRTAAVLFADDNQHVSIQTIHKKLIEAVFLELSNKKTSISSVIDFLQANYKLIFEEGEIIKIINDNKWNGDFVVEHKSNSEEIIINLSTKRFNTIQEKERANSIEKYIEAFTKEFASKTKVDIKETIYKYLYELLHTNINSFSKITSGSNSIEDINIISDSFNQEEREVINSFLNWDNDEKNKALFSIVSYSIEYCLLTNKKGGTEHYLRGIKDKIFYLDTNVIFRVLGLNGKNRQKQTLIFLQKCIDNGEKLFISKYTDIEFKEAVEYHIDQIKKVPTGKVNPKIFEEISKSAGIYEFYHKWKVSKPNSGYELFKAYILDLYKQFETEFKVTVDYKIPFDEKDEKIESQVDSYSKDIGSHKSKEGSSKNFISTNLADAQNLYLVETKRGGNCRNITDTKYFFVSTDQSLRRWDFSRSSTIPIVLLPSQWMSILLKYISRTSDDYKSFISFLNLKQSQPIIKPELLHVVLAGISEITDDFEYQSSIIHRMLEIKFDGIVGNNTSQQEIIEQSKNFTKKVMVEEIGKLKESDLEHKEKINTLQSLYSSEVDELKNNIKLHKSENVELLNQNIIIKVKHWQFKGKVFFAMGILLFIFGFFELLPSWQWNLPAQLLDWIDTCENETRKDIFKGINLFVIGGMALGSLKIWHKRHYDEKHISEFKNGLNNKDKE